ncbi:MAG TPA: DUF1559 domain-containing protein, partial [Pirellulales bacterium]|nr:DUF1559 domain-containing protein [Pirellulales bacterium]
MELFSITCTTCRARLKVRDAAAIGQILGCPKCGSMVQVVAPEGWQPPPAQASVAAGDSSISGNSSIKAPVAGNASSGGVTDSARWRDEVRSGAERQEVTRSAAAASGKKPVWSDPVPDGGATTSAAAGSIWSKWTWTQWVLWGGMPAVALAAAVSVWIWSRNHPRPSIEPVAAATRGEPRQASGPEPAAEPEPVEDEAIPLDRRWIPSSAQGLLSFSLQRLDERPVGQAVFYHLGEVWSRGVQPLFAQFKLTPSQIRRLTWTTTDLAQEPGEAWLAAGVTIVELAPDGNPDRSAFDSGDPLDWKLGDATVYASNSPAWPHPFAMVDEFTIVTGPEPMLKELADRSEPTLNSAALGRLFELVDFDRGAVGAVDLAAMREANTAPEWLPLVDVWHVSRDDWRMVREAPAALSVEVDLHETLDIRLQLACETETAAEQVRESLDRLLGAMEGTAAGEVEGLTKKLLAGQITTAGAARFKRLLSAGEAALKSRSTGVEGDVAWVSTPWQGDLPALAVAALTSIPELETTRLAAARVIDEQNHQRLLQALTGYEKAEGALPFGAAEASLLPPETRLSWIATLLPYYDHLDWHDELNFARSWNDAANGGVSRRPLESVINPALGPSATKAGFPVTHYVGLAGVGPDAALLEPTDPRAGAFGHRRQVGFSQMGDGASNTIAVMGVSGKLGAWASGGDATVRSLTQRPYINGPDGFGSGQPNGMLAGMADGSVRFLSSDIDPAVLEALATMNGAEKLPPAFDRSPQLAKSTPKEAAGMPAAPQPKAKPEPPPATPPRPDPEADAKAVARLNEPLDGMEFENTPLIEAIRLLSGLSTVPITLDLEALAELGISPNQKVSLKVADTTMGGVLSAVLDELGLAYVIVDGQALVTHPKRREQNLKDFKFDVKDLLAGSSDDDLVRNGLAGAIERFVEPTSWQAAGGAGSLKLDRDQLVLRQTAPVAQQVSNFLDKL